jgi:Family of unknown function (DUF5906)/Domain of unknown function (DUF3854)
LKANETSHEQMMAKLRESGITTPALIKRLGFRPLTKGEAEQQLPGLPEYRGGFVIPYFNIDGDNTNHYRFRYLEQDLGFNSLTGKNPLKYAQPGKSPVAVYFSPEKDWKLALEADEDLYITEGELKAICACHLLPEHSTLGLGGAWMFLLDGELHPDIRQLVRPGRRFYIMMDSDAKDNLHVRQAENKLARLLTDAGAMPHIVRLPSIMGKDRDGKELKTGLDDFLLKKDKEALQALIDGTEADAPARALNEMAAEVVYLKGSDIVYCPADNLRMKTEKFVASQYANRHYIQEVETKDGGKRPVEKDTAKEFMKWEARPELNKFTFVPGGESIIGRDYNLWAGWAFEPVKGDVTPWIRFMKYIFDSKPKEERLWFERWVAYPIQHPGTKLKSAPIMWGQQGSGKTFLGEIIARLYGWRDDNEVPNKRQAACKFSNHELKSQFTNGFEAMQFALGDEIVVDMTERSAMSEHLKRLVTDTTIRIEYKYVNSYTLPHCMNIMLTSNKANAIKIEPNDRRYLVTKMPSGRLPPEIYKPLKDWCRSTKGMSAFMYYLRKLDLGDFDPDAEPPVGADKIAMRLATSTSHAAWLQGVYDFPDEYLVMDNVALPYEFWSTHDLLTLFKRTHGNQDSRVTEITIGNVLNEMEKPVLYPGVVRICDRTKVARLRYIPRSPGTEGKYKHIAKRPADIGRAYDKERNYFNKAKENDNG